MKKLLPLLLLPFSLCAQDNTRLFDEYMKGQSDLYGFSGNVLIARKGTVIYEKSFGYSDYTSRKKLDKNSIFDCGSIAKEFTSMGILLLKDKGKIDYSDSLGKLLPELPYSSVTIQQLLTHTSGIPDGFGLLYTHFDHNKIATNEDLIRLLAREKPPLLFKPGENLMYSGTAFNLLATIIEKLSGQSYNRYMHEQVFKPLGMAHTQVANRLRSEANIPGYASGYLYSDSLKKYIRADSRPSGWTTYLVGINGEGMIITTAEDLLKWDRALKNSSLLTQSTQAQMVSLQYEKTSVPVISYGYGIRVGKNNFGDYVFHNGYYPGYTSMHLRYNEDDITVIVLSNNESRSDFIADGLAGICLNKNIIMPYAHKENVSGIDLNLFVGKYMMRLARPPYMALFPTELVVKNNKLYIHPARGSDIELKPESDTKFFFADGTDQQLEFETAKDNPVKVWHTAWGIRTEIKRIN
jgi:CubicO group peptidase (beta-lactamase class C family)